MKIERNGKQTPPLTPDSQKRLVAYTTAAGLGAFFAGQGVEAQVVESQALAPYPRTVAAGGSPYGVHSNYFYLSIDDTGTNELNFVPNTWRVTFGGIPSTVNFALNPSTNSYLVPWTNGMILDATTGSKATYKNFLANGIYRYGVYLFNNFTNAAPVGFEFQSAKDGLPHFGYMQVKVNGERGVFGDFTATVFGIYYNATPSAGITIGAVPEVVVAITDINVGAGNSVTIDFTSSDSAPASAFTLETSPALGAAASWTTDVGAVISSNSPGFYQAVTTGTGGPDQFFRISH